MILTSRRYICLLLLPLLVLAMVAVSCGTGEQLGIRPLDDLPGGFDGPHVRNVGPHSASIVFTSQVPIVCNVAYGTDTSYGRLSLMAMTGPLTDHDVQLLGLEPSTTYHFRVTVTDQKANVYGSDDSTFTTSEGDGNDQPSGRNVAAPAAGAKVVGVSSNWADGNLDSSFGGNKAIDGDPSTAWSSDGDGDGAWIEIELDQKYDLDAIGFWTRTMGTTAQISRFTVSTEAGSQLGPFDLPDAATIYYFNVQVQAKRLRFEVDASSGGNTGAVEIEVYAK
jgi:hypothetical protein